MDNCMEHMEMVSAYIDGELSAYDRQRLEDHLRVCANCSSIFDAYRGISHAVSESLAPAPETLCSGVMERISRIDTVRAAANMKKFKTVNIILTRLVPVAACIVFLLLTVPRIIGLVGNTSTDASFGSAPFSMDMAFPQQAGGGADMSAPEQMPMYANDAATSFEQDEADRQYNLFDDDGNSASAMGDAPAGAAPAAPQPPIDAPGSAGELESQENIDSPNGNRQDEPPADNAPSLPEESGLTPDVVVDPNYDRYFAIVFVSGRLPDILKEYEPDNMASSGVLSFEIPRHALEALIEEAPGHDGITINPLNEDRPYALVLYTPD